MLLLSTTGLVALPAAPAGATNYSGANGSLANCDLGNPGGVNVQTERPNVYYYYDPNVVANNSVKIHQDWAWNSVYGPTSLQPVAQGSPTSATNFVAYTQNYTTFCGQTWWPAGGLVGLTTCVSLVGAGPGCHKHEVRYSLTWWTARDDSYHRHVACHETGHAFGVTHSDQNGGDTNDCMRANIDNVQTDYISPHDVSHVNGGPDRLGTALMPTTLDTNQVSLSWDGRYRLVMQSDQNLVLYDTCCGYTPIWGSSTNNSTYHTWAVMQGDGNFVLYRSDGWSTWAVCSTRTNGHTGAYIVNQTDGNLVIYTAGGTPIWATKGGGQCN